MRRLHGLDLREQKGAVMVEFAVLFLLLLVFAFAVIEIGFLWMQSHYINNAAREGARAAAKLRVDENPAPVVEDTVREMLRGVYGDTIVDDPGNCCGSGNFIAIDIAESNVDPGDLDLRSFEVTVEVQTAEIWEPVLWDILSLLPGSDGFSDINSLQGSALFVRRDQSPP
jgi:hypothetical protein